MNAQAKYEILLKVRDQIRGLDETVRGLKQAKNEANSFGRELRQGFAIGIGNQVVQQLTMMPRRIMAMTNSLVDARLEMDAIRGRLDFVAGPKAQALWEHLKRKADYFGQSLATVADQYGNVKVAADLANFSAAETESIVDGILSAATTLSLRNDQVYGSFKALTDIMSKGTVTAEDLKGQLGDQLPGAMGLAAESLGLTQAELIKLMSNGQIMAKDLLPALGKRLQEIFGPSVQARASQLQGKVNRLNNEWFQMKLALGDGGVIEAYTETLGDMLEIAKDEDFQEGLKGIAQGIGGIATASAEAVKHFGPLFAELTAAAPVAMRFARNVLSQRNVDVGPGPRASYNLGQDLFDAFVETYASAGGGGGGRGGKAPHYEITAPPGGGGDDGGPSTDEIRASILKKNFSTNGIVLGDVASRRELLELDPLTSMVEKQGLLVDLIRQELELRKQQNRYREEILANENGELDDDSRLKLLEELQGDGLNIANLEAMLMRLDDFSDGLQSSMIDWLESFGTTSEQVAGIITGTLQGAIDAIASSIDGLIFGTMTWGEAFANVGRQILRTILQLVIQFIAQQLIMLGSRAAFGKSMMALAAGEAAGLSALWATPATLATIASYGGAAVAAPGMIGGAIGVTQGITQGINAGSAAVGGVAGFAEGGLVTGPGGPKSDAILARLSNMEYVMPADKTRAYLPLLEAMRSGSPTISDLANGAGGLGGTEILVVGSLAEAMDAAADRSGLVNIREMNATLRRRV